MSYRTNRSRLISSTVLAGFMAVAAPAAITLLTPTLASAQDYTSGVLSGTVNDTSGAPISGATVTVVSGQGTSRTATTGDNGAFRFPALPIGSYDVTISSSVGSATQRVSVAPGGASYDFTIGQAVSSSGATDLGDVVVTAQRVQAFNATDTGLTVDVQEFAERVPTGRSINAVTLFAPGASAPDNSINASARRNQSLVSLSGTTAAESVYYINGMNVTDQRNLLGYAELPFDFIQTIETKTGGYQAEFGRGTGGVINIVTRSGSNEWTGGVSAFWTPDSLRASRGTAWNNGVSNNVATTEIYNQYATAELKDYTAFLGGPIWRDHLFFFGVYNVRDSEAEGARTRSISRVRNSDNTAGTLTPSSTISQVISAYDDPRWAVKLDFVINPDHRIEATYTNDETTTVSQTRTFSATTGAQTAITDPIYAHSGGTTEIVKYTGVFTDWLTFSALYGRLEAAYLDEGNPVSMPGVRNFESGAYLTAGRPATYNVEGYDIRKTYRADVDIYASLFGDHHFRIGYDREDLESLANNTYSGGAYYGFYPSAGLFEVITFTNKGQFEAEQSAFYIQDAWEVTPDFSLQLGVRNDRYDYKNAAGLSYVELKDQWAPRLGFNWDPFGQGLDRVYGSVGDYYLPVATNTSIRASSGEDFRYDYYEIPAGGPTVDASGRPILGPAVDRVYYSPPGVPDPRAVTEADLEPMYEREFILGYEHRFDEGMFADWRAGVRYVNRNLENAFEDTQIGDAVARWCTRTGNTTCVAADGSTPADGADFSSLFNYVLVNPGSEAVVFVDLQGDTRTNADGSPNTDYNPQTITLTQADLQLPEVERTYQAMEFTFERPFDGTWGLQGSYTLAESKGNYEGAVKSDTGQTDTSLTQDYDHAANQLGAYGYNAGHHRHTLKLFGSWAPTDRIGIGTSFTAQSGRRYGCLGRVPTTIDPYAPVSGQMSAWYCPFGPNNSTIQTPRGSQGVTPWTYQVDMNFSFKLLETENRGNLTASIDVFNVFDNDAVTRVVEEGMIRNDATATTSINYSARNPYYGNARSYQSPRSIRFGLRYSF